LIVAAAIVLLCWAVCAMSSLCSRAEERRERESDKWGVW
jgi:hypothetical protein